jgi:hypothetical protein
VEHGERVELRHPVGLIGLGNPERVQHVLEEAVAPAPRHAEAARAERRSLADGEIRMIEHRDGHGVDGVPDGDALPLDEVKGHRGVEGVHDDEAGAVGEGRERDAEAAPGPRHGQSVEHPVRLGDAQALPAYQPWGTAFRWLITAPLGNDVVPDV